MQVSSTRAEVQVPEVRRPVPVPVSTHERRALNSGQSGRRDREGAGLFAKLVAIGFWGTLALLIVGAAVFPEFLVLFMIPLLGLGYLVFCLIAIAGNQDVE